VHTVKVGIGVHTVPNIVEYLPMAETVVPWLEIVGFSEDSLESVACGIVLEDLLVTEGSREDRNLYMFS